MCVCHDASLPLNSILHKYLSSFFVAICVSPIIAKQWLSKNITAITKTQATTEEL
jgi:hypothetical protein